MQIIVVFVTYSQKGEIKEVLPFYPVQYVQESFLNLYMIWQRKTFITIEVGCVALLRSVLCSSPKKHVALIFESKTSRVTGKCLS